MASGEGTSLEVKYNEAHFNSILSCIEEIT
jgi:hypothetical protein